MISRIGRTALAGATRGVVEHLERRQLLSVELQDGVWYIDGDEDLDRRGDRIVVELDPANSSKLRATVNGTVVGRIALQKVQGVAIYSGDGNDHITISLGKAAGTIEAVIDSGEGNDLIAAGGEDNWINGGAGDDSISGGDGLNEIDGEDGDDTIVSGGGDDVIYGGAGDDSIEGGAGGDEIHADDGDDFVDGDFGNDEIWGGIGNDEIDGGLGKDDLSGGKDDDELNGGFGKDEMGGGAGNDQLAGDNGNDTLAGGIGDDQMNGDGGEDRLSGNSGDDTLAGGLGDDRLTGGGDDDSMHGGYEEDTLRGSGGDDTLAGGDGGDNMGGGDGADTVFQQPEIDYTKWDRYDTAKEEQLVHALELVGRNDAELKAWLIEEAVRYYRGSFGADTWQYNGDLGGSLLPTFDGVRKRGGITLRNEVAGASSPSHSNTNTQEQGVDEADLVETDGRFIYMLHRHQLLILKATPAGEMRILSQTTIDGNASGIYLDGDRLTVLTQTYDRWEDRKQITLDASGNLITDERELSNYWNYSTHANVIVYDVSDRQEPSLVEHTKIEGYSSDSRVIDGQMYLVMNSQPSLVRPAAVFLGEEDIIPPEGYVQDSNGKWIWQGAGNSLAADAPMPATQRRHWWWGREPKIGEEYSGPTKRYHYRYETEAQYRARLEAMDIEDLLPGYTSKVTKPDGMNVVSSGNLVRASHLYASDGETSDYARNIFSVALLDLRDNEGGAKASTSVVGWEGQVYASDDAMYVTKTRYEWGMGGWDGELRTDIYKFGLGSSAVPLQASGSVPGWVVNQFAMDEEGEHFRIATTSSWGTGASNNVFVMKEEENDLRITGGITNLALSERIYSARFVGDRGYLVTFRQVDPLFTLDLSSPTAPSVEGILKIPGYSSYLHPINDDYVLGVGRDGDETGRVTGVQVSLFDVSDMKNPTRVDSHSFQMDPDVAWSWSAAEWDHHAFSYFPESGILALPMTSYNWRNGYQQTGGLDVLKVDPTSGFTYLGRVQHQGAAVRSLRIDNLLYSIGADAVKVVQLMDPTQSVAELDLLGDVSDVYDVVRPLLSVAARM